MLKVPYLNNYSYYNSKPLPSAKEKHLLSLSLSVFDHALLPLDLFFVDDLPLLEVGLSEILLLFLDLAFQLVSTTLSQSLTSKELALDLPFLLLFSPVKI